MYLFLNKKNSKGDFINELHFYFDRQADMKNQYHL